MEQSFKEALVSSWILLLNFLLFPFETKVEVDVASKVDQEFIHFTCSLILKFYAMNKKKARCHNGGLYLFHECSKLTFDLVVSFAQIENCGFKLCRQSF